MLESSAHSIDNVELLSARDKDQIEQWNSELPATPDSLVHAIIAKQANDNPESPAISAWDGEISYGEMEDLSTLLSRKLHDMGVRPGALVPLCLEKSLWSVISMLAVLKVGAAFIPMDASQPQRRLEGIINDVNASILLMSPQHYSKLSGCCKNILVVNHDLDLTSFRNREDIDVRNSECSHDTAFVLYTSGSTGKPKGCIIDHSAFSAAIYSQSNSLGLGKHSRVLQMASFSFDACLLEILVTLGSGGCVCMPSEIQRMVGNINQTIRTFKVNWAHLTPSVAQRINPEGLTDLRTVLFAGEPVNDLTMKQWTIPGRQLQVAYGPSECSIMATLNVNARPGKELGNVGSGVGCVCWIVDTTDHTQLLPVGAIGELVVQGPNVGQGYIGDENQNPFLRDIQFLSGRCRGRAYKTGDLASYNADGSITFVGRKDTQVKLRGQRIELSEVEQHIRDSMPEPSITAIAEVVIPSGSSEKPMLVAFVCFTGTSNADSDSSGSVDIEASTVDDQIKAILTKVVDSVADTLPMYMNPSAFIPLKWIPMTPTGKTDRTKLRQWASRFSASDLSKFTTHPVTSNSQPNTEMESKLHRLWSEVLKLDAKQITCDDSFIGLGGDSIDAMMLAGLARTNGIQLSVADIFRNPRLRDIARLAVSNTDEVPSTDIEPFSIWNETRDPDATNDAASSCKVSSDLIKDMYPCTPLQEGIMVSAARQDRAYVARHILNIPSNIDIPRYRAAWEAVMAAFVMLRTRIVQLSKGGLMQIVLDEGIAWKSASSLSSYLEQDRRMPMSFNHPLTRFAIVIDSRSESCYFVLTAHHAIFDGWSLALVFRWVDQVYKGAILGSQPNYNRFIKYLSGLDQGASANYVSLSFNL